MCGCKLVCKYIEYMLYTMLTTFAILNILCSRRYYHTVSELCTCFKESHSSLSDFYSSLNTNFSFGIQKAFLQFNVLLF